MFKRIWKSDVAGGLEGYNLLLHQHIYPFPIACSLDETKLGEPIPWLVLESYTPETGQWKLFCFLSLSHCGIEKKKSGILQDGVGEIHLKTLKSKR